jgi:PPM family protein phosphatase
MQTLAIDSAHAATLPVSLSLDDTIEPITQRRPLPAIFEATGSTHPGKVRLQNEDAYGIFPDIGLCAVADGLGGRNAGEVASAMAVHEVRWSLMRRPPSEAVSAEQALGAAIAYANQAVRHVAEVEPRCKGMASTFVGLLFSGGRVIIGHAGDSRAYRIRGGAAERLTVDHSMREMYLQVYGHRADPRIAEKNASIVTRALGGRPRIQAGIRAEQVEPGDTFLLCTDGLWGLVEDDEIAFAFAGARTLEAAVAKLMATAYNRGGHDNITALAVRPLG